MKKSVLSIMAAMAAWVLFMGNSSNPPLGRTGAPSEGTCADCHSGGNFNTTLGISGIPDTVVSGQTYTITYTHTSTAPRAGFQLVALDGTNTQCGTLTAGTGTGVATAGGRQYVRHSAAKLLSNGATTWTFTWRAPTTLSNTRITFYFSGVAANNDGGDGGDRVVTGSKTVAWRPLGVRTQELPAVAVMEVFPNPAQDVLTINLVEASAATVSVYDGLGRMVLTQPLRDRQSTLAIGHLAKGPYLVTVQTAAGIAQQKFMKS